MTVAFSLLSARASSMMMQNPERDKPFVLVDLGVPPDYTDCTVNGISADGRFITGQCTGGPPEHPVAAFVWDRDLFLAEYDSEGVPSPWIILDTELLPGGVGLSVNNTGQVAGTFDDSGTPHGFIWCPPLDPLGDPTVIDTGVGQASDIGEEDTGQPPVAYAAGWTVGQRAGRSGGRWRNAP